MEIVESRVSLRVVRSEVIGADTADGLRDALNDWFRTGQNKTFMTAFQIAALTILILYAEG